VVEAVAFSFADAVDALSAAGTMPETLLAIGGGTRSDFLIQTIADVTGCRIARTKGADIGPALGAARLAIVATGDGSHVDVMTKPPVERQFEPRSEIMQRERPRLEGYRALYPALKSVQARMQTQQDPNSSNANVPGR
jgi:xylulokinase